MRETEDLHCSGLFELNKEEYVGELIYNEQNGSVLLHLTIPTDLLGKTFVPQDIIYGRIDGEKLNVYLIKCSCIQNHTRLMHNQTLVYSAKYMIWSNKEVSDFKFNSLGVELENALKWSRLSRINRKDIDNISFLPAQKCTLQYLDYEISFESRIVKNISIYPIQEHNEIIEHIFMTIKCESDQDYRELLKVRDFFISFICFCIKDNVNILGQILNKKDDFYEVVPNLNRPYEYRLFESVPKLSIYNTEEYEYNLTLQALTPDYFRSDDNIKTFYKMKPIFNLYLSLFKYKDMPIEMVFLNIIQAVETFHARFICDKKKDFEKLINEQYGSYSDFDFIKQRLWNTTQSDDNCHYILLVSRINHLLIGEFDGLFDGYYGQRDFAQEVADTRHYYTHYDKAKEDKKLEGDKLMEAIYVLRILLEYYICREFGIDKRKYVCHSLERIN